MAVISDTALSRVQNRGQGQIQYLVPQPHGLGTVSHWHADSGPQWCDLELGTEFLWQSWLPVLFTISPWDDRLQTPQARGVHGKKINSSFEVYIGLSRTRELRYVYLFFFWHFFSIAYSRLPRRLINSPSCGYKITLIQKMQKTSL